MTDAPERIWAGGGVAEYFVNGQGQRLSVAFHDGNWSTAEQPGWTEYIRADLGSFYKKEDIEALMNERDRLREVARWFVQYAEGAPIHRGEADEMLNKPRAALLKGHDI